MYSIDGILLDEDITTAKFSCDLQRCKGACCTFPGDFGAPLLKVEISEIEKCVDAASNYLSEKSKKILNEKGFYESDDNSNLTTVCINRRDCVFVFYEGSVAKCSLEKAYFDGLTKFRKPVSCHLFPIRVGNFGGKYLYFEKIKECKPAIDKGINESTYLADYLKESLVRAFGLEWYNKFISFINNNIK